jgi:hypothetical protein
MPGWFVGRAPVGENPGHARWRRASHPKRRRRKEMKRSVILAGGRCHILSFTVGKFVHRSSSGSIPLLKEAVVTMRAGVRVSMDGKTAVPRPPISLLPLTWHGVDTHAQRERLGVPAQHSPRWAAALSSLGSPSRPPKRRRQWSAQDFRRGVLRGSRPSQTPALRFRTQIPPGHCVAR